MSQYGSVIEALQNGEKIASNIAERTGLHVSTVRKILNGYEAEGIAGRWSRKQTGLMSDHWKLIPSEHRADARRRHATRRAA